MENRLCGQVELVSPFARHSEEEGGRRCVHFPEVHFEEWLALILAADGSVRRGVAVASLLQEAFSSVLAYSRFFPDLQFLLWREIRHRTLHVLIEHWHRKLGVSMCRGIYHSLLDKIPSCGGDTCCLYSKQHGNIP